MAKNDSSSQEIRALWLPAYIPGIIYQAAIAAAIPVIPYVAANNIGISTQGVLWLFLANAICLIVGSGPAGMFIDWIGESAAMAVASVIIALSAVDIIVIITSGSHSITTKSSFIVGIIVMFLAEDIWSVARSTFVAESVSFANLGKAMSIYGITLRLGRVIGPGLGTVVLLLWGRVAVFVAIIFLGTIATLIVVSTNISRQKTRKHGDSYKIQRLESKVGRAATSIIILAAVGNIAINVVRNNRETLFTLWLRHLGFSDIIASSIYSGVLCVEVLSFFPASKIMQQLGRFRVAGLCAMITGIGFIVVALYPHPPILFIAGAILLGIGNGLGSGVVKTMGSDLSPSVGRAKFMGWWNSISNIGILSGSLIGTFIGMISLPLALSVTGVVGICGGIWMYTWALLGKDTHLHHLVLQEKKLIESGQT